MTRSLPTAANSPVMFRPLNQGLTADQIAVCATAQDSMVAVAIASIGSTPGTSRLKSLLVQEAHRHRGIAQGLLAALEQRLHAHGARRLEVTYPGGSTSADVFTHILRKAAWHVPAEPVLIFTASTRIATAPWMGIHAVGKGELFPWSELSAAETIELAAARGTSQWFPEALGPFPERPVEPVCSIGARYQGRVVGWMLSHRVDASTVRYSRLFVRQEFRRQVCGVALFAEALRRQHAAGIPTSICAVSRANAAMLRVIKRRVEPYLDSTASVCFAAKELR